MHMTRRFLMMLATLAAIAANCFAAEVPRVIFDTDMYTDYDDVGALDELMCRPPARP